MAGFDEMFGQRLRALREVALTQRQLANEMTAAGHTMYQTTIAKIESGERPVSFGEAVSFAEVLGADLDGLAGMHTAGEDSAQRALVDARMAVRTAEREYGIRQSEMAVAQATYDHARGLLSVAKLGLADARAYLAQLESGEDNPTEDDQ